jgi:hypothetical protein
MVKDPGPKEHRMRKLLPLVIVLAGVTLIAERIDPRLATVHKAFVIAADDLGDDQGVATCLAERLTAPVEVVKTKADADVVLIVKAHIPSGTSRVLLGSMGGSPSANLEAQLSDGTKIWSDGAKFRRGTGAIGLARDTQCGLAEGLVKTLRDAMRKARDAAK